MIGRDQRHGQHRRIKDRAPRQDFRHAQYGDGAAAAVTDNDSVLTTQYHPVGLTVLLVFRDATAEVLRNLPANFQLASALGELGQPGAVVSASPLAAS